MISCRIALNELPVAVAEEVLCVDEAPEDDPSWTLLSENPVSRCYKFSPRALDQSWFVRWGFDYSWGHLRDALFGRDTATKDWRNVGHAQRCRIPVLHYRFLGTPRLIAASLDTLLVTEYLHDARPLSDFFAKCENQLLVEEMLIKLGELLGRIHDSAIVHNKFKLDTVLVQYDDATRLTPTDWYYMQVNRSAETAPFKKDIIGPMRDLLNLGFEQERLGSFLDAYCMIMPWARAHAEDLTTQAQIAAQRDAEDASKA